jgi:hypothetical protein
MGNAYEILVGNPQGKRPLGGLGIDGSVILKRIFFIGYEGVDKIQTSGGLLWTR